MKIMTTSKSLASLIVLVLFALNGIAFALDVNITQDLSYVAIEQNGETVRIQRIQDQSNHLSGGFAKTSRKCHLLHSTYDRCTRSYYIW